MAYLNEDGLETLVGKIKGQVIELTSAEYRQLPATKNTDNKLYFVNDEAYAYQIDDEPTADSTGLVKSGGVYNWTSKIGSGTLTTTAQTLIPAVNELNAAVDELNTGLIDLNGLKITNVSTAGSNPLTFTTESGHSYLIVAAATASSHCGMWIVRGSSTEAFVFDVKVGSALTASNSGGAIKISKSSGRNTYFTVVDFGENVS